MEPQNKQNRHQPESLQETVEGRLKSDFLEGEWHKEDAILFATEFLQKKDKTDQTIISQALLHKLSFRQWFKL